MKTMKTDPRSRPARQQPNLERGSMETMDTHGVEMASALKRQFESGLAVLEAVTEGSRRLQEAQLKAVAEARAAIEAAHKRLAKAGDGQDVWRIQSEWMSASLERSLACWRELYETAIDTESSISKLLAAQLPLAMTYVPGAGNATAGPIAEMINNAYSRWMEGTRQFYREQASLTSGDPAAGSARRTRA